MAPSTAITVAEERERKQAEWRAYVEQYASAGRFPFEVGETVWIVKPEFRAPLGEFRISKAHPNDRFELVKTADNTVYPELVEGKFLHRNPYAPGP